MAKLEPRGLRRVITAVAVVTLGVAGCGGSSDESAAMTPSTASGSVDAGELAGVHVEVRRDPG